VAREPNENNEIFDGFLHLSWRPRRELSAIAMMLMELSWSVAWFQFLVAPELSLTLGESFLLFGLWMAIAYSLARGMHVLSLHKNVRRVLMLAVFLVSMLAIMRRFYYTDTLTNVGAVLVRINDAFKNTEHLLPVEIIVFSFASYIWHRGIVLAGVWIDARYAARRFRLGAMMLVALGIFTPLRRVEGLTLGIVLYLSSSLLAIGASRASTIELLRGGRTRLLDMGWLASMTIASIGVAVLVWFLGIFATAKLGDPVVAAFFFLLQALVLLGLLIVSPLLFIVLLLFQLLDNKLQTSPLFQEIQGQVAFVIERVMAILDEIGSLLEGFLESLPALTFVKPVVLWLFIGLLLTLILSAASIRRRRSVFQEGASSTSESISDSEGVGAWLRQILGSSVGALSERLSIFQRGGRLFGALRVRVIYANLMHLCEEFDCPRRRVQTPLEFLPTLRGLFPKHFDEIELITETYNRVRYGELPEVSGELQRVEEAWRRVREQAKNLHLAQEYLGNEA